MLPYLRNLFLAFDLNGCSKTVKFLFHKEIVIEIISIVRFHMLRKLIKFPLLGYMTIPTFDKSKSGFVLTSGHKASGTSYWQSSP